MRLRDLLLMLAVAALALSPWSSAAGQGNDAAAASATATPVKHLVVIFQENVSFDHYFGTYPHAANPAGEPAFHAAASTPVVNGLNDGLLTSNPNLSNPQRLDRSQAHTCDMDHGYTNEQKAAHKGALDKFVEVTSNGAGPTRRGLAAGRNWLVAEFPCLGSEHTRAHSPAREVSPRSAAK